MIKRIAVGVLSLAISGAAMAVQKITVDDGKTYKVNVALTEASRITVEKGRIVRAWSMNTNWQVKEDKEAGDIYIKPANSTRKAFSFFVQDNYGNTYTLVAVPVDTPSETIVLKPSKRIKSAKSSNVNQPYVQRSKGMIKDMVNGEEGSYVVTELHEEVPLWKEADIHLVKRFELNELMGEIYQIRNVSGAPMVFAEQEFANFGEGIVAIALERTEILSGDSGMLYVVRGEETDGGM